jgi:hypothetical protein
MNRVWMCHFCGKVFHSFEKREEHIVSKHLKEKIMNK